MGDTALDAGIRAIQAMGRPVPDPLEALSSKVDEIHRTLSEGTTLQARYDQVVGLLAAALGREDRMANRLELLEKKVFGRGIK